MGSAAVLGSTLFLYLSTLVMRWARAVTDIGPAYFTFARFALGLAAVSLVMCLRRLPLQWHHRHLLLGRAVTNCISVFCFYKAVEVTTVAEANILNMTYPLFVPLLSWVALRRREQDGVELLALLAAMLGVWLVLAPEGLSLKVANLWGLASGILGAAATIYLTLSRRHHDTHSNLFVLFGFGTLATGAVGHAQITLPDATQLAFLLACAASGVLGQYLLTLGFRYVTAVEGSVLSSTRILIAALLGPWLAADPPLTLSGWIGALLIFAADICLAAWAHRAAT
jgi:drug/metabolite transporter (DMT)-like permease